MEIQCKVAFESFEAGRVALFYLLGHRCLNDYNDLLVFVQVHGHVQISEKWIKGSTKLLESIDQTNSIGSLDYISSLPADPTPEKNSVALSSSKCIFVTTRVPLSPTALSDVGMFVECELPFDILPSHKGRAVHANYYLSVQLQSNHWFRTYHFPFNLHGSGSRSAPFLIKYGGIVVYPPTSIPSECFLNSDLYVDTVESSDRVPELIQYCVRDEGYICNINLLSTELYLGQAVDIVFDFSNGNQPCQAVRVSLVLYEKRIDDSNVQERTIVTLMKTAECAKKLNLRLNIPSSGLCSFFSPLIKVYYQYLFEFYTLTSSGESTEEPLSFSIPVNIRYAHTIINNTNTSSRRNLSRTDICLLSLESSHVRVPIVIDS